MRHDSDVPSQHPRRGTRSDNATVPEDTGEGHDDGDDGEDGSDGAPPQVGDVEAGSVAATA